MKTSIRRIEPFQTAKIMALLTAAMSLVILVPMMLLFSAFGLYDGSLVGGAMAGSGIISLLIFPILYAIFGFIGTLIYCGLYNLIASRTGGIELDLSGYGDFETEARDIGGLG